MTCNKCQHNSPDDSVFCQYCGNRLDVQSSETAIDKSCHDPSNKNNTQNTKRLNRPIAGAIILTLSVLLFCVALFAFLQFQNNIRLQNQIEQLQNQVADKDKVVENYESQIKSQKEAIEQLETKYQALKSKNLVFSSQLSNLGSQTVIIYNPSTQVYHPGVCYETVREKNGLTETTYLLDVTLALQLGYTACPMCK